MSTSARHPRRARRVWTSLTAPVRIGIREFARPGETSISPVYLRRLTELLLSGTLILTNVVGAAVVVALLVLHLIPLPPFPNEGTVRLQNGVLAGIFVLAAVPVGWLLGYRMIARSLGWLRERRPPREAETRALLSGPRRLFGLQLGLWLGAAALFGLFDLRFSGTLGLRVAVVVCLTGFVTAALAYLSAERVLRSLTARALVTGVPGGVVVPGVVTRILLAWGLGTVVPVGGLLSIGIYALAGGRRAVAQSALAISTIALTGTGILVGLVAVLLAVRTISEPINSVRRGLARVQRGDFGVRVPVYDASDLGQLQQGFNAMTEGLAERERIREAFGTYVDPDVAEKIIAAGTDLAGEAVEVTCMFLDVRNFTGFAERQPAAEVVATLNRLFDRVVPLIHEHDGRIDAFVGDGLLAVFGAPRRLENHAAAALAAAEAIRAAVAGADFGLEIGIGLNSGPVLAGNVGGGGRFEFSVIGDTVNVAARVEAATRETGDTILVSESTRLALPGPVAERLLAREGIALKGKRAPVALYAVPAPA
ncbi:MAG TPA: adenylate/guanylate cyclase domain-containing protein [Solirubrobacteraceae bacterium]|nr:adenylate/guanylate cyclase domain-containing protein [Solirubrobacteraceae bacterium]